MEPARRMDGIGMSGIRRMFEAAPPDAVHLGLGEPDMDPPEHVVDAHVKALRGGLNHYGPSAGLPELRQAIADHERPRQGDLGPENVVVTVGSTSALYGLSLAFLNPGDEILVPDPGFVLYSPHARMAGARPVPYVLHEDRGYGPDLEAVQEAVTDRTRMIVVNSPSNPTGGMLDEAAVSGLVDLAEDHDLLLVSDEAYDRITYDAEHLSFLGRSDHVAYLNTFSKAYAATGWRLGYAVAAPEVADALKRHNYHVYACPPTPPQHAAIAALRGPQDFVDRLAGVFRERRDLVVDRIREIPGLHLDPPGGAFYAFPRYDLDRPSAEVCMDLLAAGVVTSPGSAFGPHGEGHIRLSYAASLATLGAGLDRIEAWFRDQA